MDTATSDELLDACYAADFEGCDVLDEVLQRCTPSIINSIDNKKGLTALHVATILDNSDCIDMLIRSGADINIPDSSGRTPLYIGVTKDSVDSVRMLLDNGSDITLINKINGKTVLLESYAHFGNRSLVLPLILKYGSNDGNVSKRVEHHHQLAPTYKSHFASCGVDIPPKAKVYSENYRVYYKLCIDILYGQVLEVCSIKLSIFSLLNEVNPVFYFVCENLFALTSTVLENNLDYDFNAKKNSIPLLFALASTCNNVGFKFFVERNLCNLNIYFNQNSLVSFSYKHYKLGILLANNAFVDATDVEGQTCLMMECSDCDIETVNVLISYNANVNHRDKYHNTALHLVTGKKSSKALHIVKLLLSNGAKVKTKNIYGKTPFLNACEFGEGLEMLETILEHGGLELLFDLDNDNQNMYHLAVQNNLDTLLYLLRNFSHIISPNFADTNGNTPLHFNDITCYQYFWLVFFGADVNALNSQGSHPNLPREHLNSDDVNHDCGIDQSLANLQLLGYDINKNLKLQLPSSDFLNNIISECTTEAKKEIARLKNEFIVKYPYKVSLFDLIFMNTTKLMLYANNKFLSIRFEETPHGFISKYKNFGNILNLRFKIMRKLQLAKESATKCMSIVFGIIIPDICMNVILNYLDTSTLLLLEIGNFAEHLDC